MMLCHKRFQQLPILFIVIFFALILSSCKKDNNSSSDPKVLPKIISAKTDQFDLEFTTDSLVKSVTCIAYDDNNVYSIKIDMLSGTHRGTVNFSTSDLLSDTCEFYGTNINAVLLFRKITPGKFVINGDDGSALTINFQHSTILGLDCGHGLNGSDVMTEQNGTGTNTIARAYLKHAFENSFNVDGAPPSGKKAYYEYVLR